MFRILQQQAQRKYVVDNERKPQISTESYNRFEKLYKDLRKTNGLTLINFYDYGYERGRSQSGICNLITSDGNLQINLILTYDNVVKLKFVYNNDRETPLGENIINRVLNLCQEYDFHLELYASPIHLTGEFRYLRENPVGKYISQFYGQMVSNPLVRSRLKKYFSGLKNYLNTTDRKTIDTIYGLTQYYKKFGFIVLPFSLTGFLTEGRTTMYSGFHMCWFNPNLNLKKTYPYYCERVYSQCGSTKRTFSWKESVEFINWVVDNKRFELLGRNDDFFRAMLFMDTQLRKEYETSESEELKSQFKPFIEMRNEERGYGYSDWVCQFTAKLVDMEEDVVRNIRQLNIEIPNHFKGILELIGKSGFYTHATEQDILKGKI